MIIDFFKDYGDIIVFEKIDDVIFIYKCWEFVEVVFFSLSDFMVYR